MLNVATLLKAPKQHELLPPRLLGHVKPSKLTYKERQAPCITGAEQLTRCKASELPVYLPHHLRKNNPTCRQIRYQNHTNQMRHRTNAVPWNITAMLLMVCRPQPPNHLIPIETTFLSLFSGEMLCGSASTGQSRTQLDQINNFSSVANWIK